ncbi:MAG: hypothetical protein ABSB23_15010 [Bryobacteraceae bacterium]|jgi:hypothetical protein
MTKKSLFLVGFVSVCTLALAGTKSYAVVFYHPEAVGAQQLAPGEYKLKVENGTATFTDVHTKKSVSAPVKVETANRKFAATAVESVADGKTDRVSAIQLGGSTTKVEFSAAAATHGSM